MKQKKNNIKLTFEDVESALEQSRFEPYFQPFHDVSNGRCIGAEVLVRLQHPELGTLYPGSFLQVITDYDLLLAVTNMLMGKVEAALSRWAHCDSFMISFNIPPEFINEEQLIQSFLHLHENTCDKITLLLEITEKDGECIYGKNYISKINKLRASGIKIALDDFGTGRSDFRRLQKIAVDYLKIPKDFVSSMQHDCTSEYLIESVIYLAQRLNIDVIAEGVENERQTTMLSNRGVKYMQGYYYSKAIQYAEFSAYLKRYNFIINERTQPDLMVV